MGSNDFNPNRRLTTRAQARNALEDCVSQVGQHLRVFDDRGEFYGLDRRALAEPLGHALRQKPALRITMVLHDTRHLVEKGARLIELVRAFEPRLQIYRTTGSVRSFARGLIVADQMVVLRRPHFDAAVTIVDYSPEAIAQAGSLFDELLVQSEPATLGAVTGL
jgi:hypothetical protein